MSESGKSDESAEQKDPLNPPDFGYDFYPERHGKEKRTLFTELTNTNVLPFGKGQKLKCIKNVYKCANESVLTKLLLGALKSHGCPVDFKRHVSCEKCTSGVNGGYDPVNNQVVICENYSRTMNLACSVLTHELIHMFDFCRAKVDFKNLEHVACTEIRAANIMHCSFQSAWADGDASLTDIKKKHRECVKRKALLSILMVRPLEPEEGMKIVDKVFDKCYKDMEPFGRIPRHDAKENERIYHEGFLYGYVGSAKSGR